MKLNRHQRADHIIRMDNGQIPKRPLLGNMGGKTPKDCPSKNMGGYCEDIVAQMQEIFWGCEGESSLLLIV